MELETPFVGQPIKLLLTLALARFWPSLTTVISYLLRFIVIFVKKNSHINPIEPIGKEDRKTGANPLSLQATQSINNYPISTRADIQSAGWSWLLAWDSTTGVGDVVRFFALLRVACDCDRG